jgi:hypothetical protein
MPIREAHRVVKIYGVFESSRKVESTFDYIYKIRKLRISRFVAHSTFYQQQIVQLQKIYKIIKKNKEGKGKI